jgi:ADP-ribosylglycohydrolase
MVNFWIGAMVGGMFGAFLGVLLMSAMNAAAMSDLKEEWMQKYRNANHHEG